MPFSHFAEDFFELCRYSLLSADRTAARERTINFIVRAVIHIIANAPDRNDGKPRNLLLIKAFLFCSKVIERCCFLSICIWLAFISAFLLS